ncbi:MAG: L-serine ammonia-lyase, iron-sulfur-dependent, subunit alpha [Limnochordia bacterium]|jgi:L-serine dehydratase|nr:L-serine ammonia-lyase, iron-sulfur-dependent, subunit alpha [Limnochordia bacterium]MDD4517847.1 L-serine ammonia-lyase, iron-sulfur-dependent, subunit alpha [Limnochordia bacterium]
MDKITFTTARELIQLAEGNKLSIGTVVAQYEACRTETELQTVYDQMREQLKVMKESVQEGLSEHRGHGLIVGDFAAKLLSGKQSSVLLGGPLFEKMVIYATAVAEVNATMGRIVACPTAGSCGILPAAVLGLAEERQLSEDDILEGVFAAAGIGIVSSNVCALNGAVAGCQAECGVASAMAAAAIVAMVGSEPELVVNAASIALQCQLGLVCDPVAGLVEIPCVYRNASGVAAALSSANLALARIPCVIPYDEVVDTMAKIGRQMPRELKETSLGGLATTPTGKAITKELALDCPAVT